MSELKGPHTDSQDIEKRIAAAQAYGEDIGYRRAMRQGNLPLTVEEARWFYAAVRSRIRELESTKVGPTVAQSEKQTDELRRLREAEQKVYSAYGYNLL